MYTLSCSNRFSLQNIAKGDVSIPYTYDFNPSFLYLCCRKITSFFDANSYTSKLESSCIGFENRIIIKRGSLMAAPSRVKLSLLLFHEEVKQLTFSGIDFLALSHNVAAENFILFGLFAIHSSKLVCGEIIPVIQGTRTTYRPDCWRSQAYFFDSCYLVRLFRTLLLIVNFNAFEQDTNTKQ